MSIYTNSLNINQLGVVSYDNTTGVFSGSSLTQHDVLIGGASNAIVSVSPSTSGFVLTSNGTGSDPSFQAIPAAGGLTLAAFGSTPNADGLTLTSGVLNMEPANGSNPGGVSTTTQTFAGTKTFSVTAFSPNFSSGQSLVTSASGTTVLTVNSNRIQQLRGTNPQTFQLPDATTLLLGFSFEFNNNSSGTLTIVANDGVTTILTMVPGSYARVSASSVSTTNGTWDYHWLMPSSAVYGTSGLTVTGSIAATTSLSTGANSGSSGSVLINGSTSGTISVLPQAAAGTYNFNLPTTAGTSGYFLTSAGGGSSPMTWTNPSSLPQGTVTSVSVVSANGFAGSVANPTTTPAITLSTTVTGLIQGNGTAISGISGTNNGVLITDNTGVISWLANSGTPGYVLTANAGAPPSWQAGGGGGGGITTINGDTGSVTGSTVTITTGAGAGGSTFTTSGSGTTFTIVTTDVNNNTMYGGSAGRSAGITGTSNSGFGAFSLGSNNFGVNNTALGVSALGNLNGLGADNNTAVGVSCLNGAITSGFGNTGLGANCATSLGDGSYNIIIGESSGSNYTSTESSNIIMNSPGVVSESNALHIGAGTGTGNKQLNSAFISGIQGITVTGSAVLVSSGDQLGVAVSSRKYKENIVDMGDYSSNILKLRPVTFTLKGHKDQTIQSGLIAEEVHEIFPDIMVYDKNGDPQTVQYHNLPALLLNELQKALKRIDVLESKLKI
jgi:trimeric autotransporter adhesin